MMNNFKESNKILNNSLNKKKFNKILKKNLNLQRQSQFKNKTK